PLFLRDHRGTASPRRRATRRAGHRPGLVTAPGTQHRLRLGASRPRRPRQRPGNRMEQRRTDPRQNRRNPFPRPAQDRANRLAQVTDLTPHPLTPAPPRLALLAYWLRPLCCRAGRRGGPCHRGRGDRGSRRRLRRRRPDVSAVSHALCAVKSLRLDVADLTELITKDDARLAVLTWHPFRASPAPRPGPPAR